MRTFHTIIDGRLWLLGVPDKLYDQVTGEKSKSDAIPILKAKSPRIKKRRRVKR